MKDLIGLHYIIGWLGTTPKMKLIFEWELPKDHPNFSGYDDLPEAYRVSENNDATCGIVIEARWHGEWKANPWNTRTLVRHLLRELKKMEG